MDTTRLSKEISKLAWKQKGKKENFLKNSRNNFIVLGSNRTHTAVSQHPREKTNKTASR